MDLSATPTPILDLVAPLPRRRPSDLAFGQYLIAAAVLLSTLLSRDYQLFIPITILWAIALLTIAVHEAGHIAGGLAVGFVFQRVGIGPLLIRRASGRWSLRLRHGLLDGKTLMSLDEVCRARKRLLIYIGAGPAVGLLVGLAAVVCLRISIAHDRPAWSLFLALFGAYSILLNVANLVPGRYRRLYGNDGMRLKVLLCSKRGAEQIIATHAVQMQRHKGVDPFCFNTRWTRVALSHGNVAMDSRYADYADGWDTYRKDPSLEAAAKFLEQRLANSAFLSQESRDALCVEVATFMAWRRNDVDRATTWLQRVANPRRVHPLISLRAEGTLNCAQGKFDEAARCAQRGLEIIRCFPPSDTSRKHERKWVKWQQDIEARKSSQAGATTSSSATARGI